jgi:hypothetical protein
VKRGEEKGTEGKKKRRYDERREEQRRGKKSRGEKRREKKRREEKKVYFALTYCAYYHYCQRKTSNGT